jgi:hypothetical protein
MYSRGETSNETNLHKNRIDTQKAKHGILISSPLYRMFNLKVDR